MRKWHRWVSLFAGFFMLWMSVTGLIIHFNDIAGEKKGPPPAASAQMGVANAATPAGAAPADGAKPAFVCPPDYMCRPKGKGGKISFVGLIKHLHSGEQFGPVGTLLSILSGVSLLFFSISGIWMYVQMWQMRKSRKLTPRWLWK
ncbi:MAG TPA: PepSY-associated TM helix domain-containing protein [Novosphingobium sp.]|nr:PepSY-associated TM helix domain-containing protein [Novosphingobium sp.]